MVMAAMSAVTPVHLRARMNGLLQVPIFDDEILDSFLSRLAHANGRRTFPFCRDLRLDFLRILSGNPVALAKLSEICGESPDKLSHHAVSLSNGKKISLLGHGFQTRALDQTSVRFCPDCFHRDDIDTARKQGTRRYIRAAWLVRDVTTCPHHSRALVAVSPPSSHRNIGVYEVLERASQEVDERSALAPARPASRLDIFVHERFQGIVSHGDALDNLDIAVAIDLSRQLGVALVYGKKQFVTKLDPLQQASAMLVGFAALEKGKQGLYAALDTLASQGDQRAKSFHAAYGRLHASIVKKRADSAYDVPRVWISDHAEQKVLFPALLSKFGQAENETKPSSLSSVTRATGMSKYMIERHLAEAGLNLDSDARSVQATLSALVARGAGKPITSREAAKILGSDLKLFLQMVTHGLVPTLEMSGGKSSENKSKRRTNYFSEAEVKLLWTAIRERAKGSLEPDMLSIRQLARKKNIPQVEILSRLMKDEFKAVAYLNGKSLADCIMISPREIATTVLADTHVNATAAASILGFPRSSVSKFLNNGVLEFTRSDSVRAVAEHMISLEDLDTFRKRYISIGQLAKSTGMDKNTLTARTKTRNIQPAFPRKEYGVFLFKREEVGNLFGE